ncbi:MAG TPA: hypothetical protein DCQ98_10095 [Planctomycetaceae bacterium]|nr:hypothetical protein [Planctomycetaceae bacterium]
MVAQLGRLSGDHQLFENRHGIGGDRSEAAELNADPKLLGRFGRHQLLDLLGDSLALSLEDSISPISCPYPDLVLVRQLGQTQFDQLPVGPFERRAIALEFDPSSGELDRPFRAYEES